jgi:predicted phage terminase large subunit-like protein
LRQSAQRSAQWLPSLEAIKAEQSRRAARRERERIERDADAIRARCRTLAGFVREAWPVLEPNARLVWNWHLDALCLHLEAITFGRMKPRLLANVPPGSSKSLVVSVLWQAWEWGPCGLASLRYLTTAFNDVPVKRDTRKCRDLILSEWYRSLWPEVVLTRAGETSFANSNTGTREGVAFGSLTSQRGDRLIIDDPHSTETAESDAERQRTTRRFREGAMNRLNDQERSAIVVVMQRLHEDDVSGVILKLGMDFIHLMLPMEFEPERRCCTVIGFADPRSADGELLDPVRFPRSTVDALKRDMGSYAFAGQCQQRPTPREGGMFKRAWFDGKIIKEPPERTVWVRHWDLAATKKATAARTAGVKLGRTPDGRYVVGHVVTTQDEGTAVRKLIKTTAEVDGKDVMISLPQDPGQAGKVQKSDFVALLAGWNVRADPETGDKETRALPFSAQCEAGNVYIVKGAWNDAYLDELCLFPGGSFKDQVDASSGAFGRLVSSISTPAISAEFHGFY